MKTREIIRTAGTNVTLGMAAILMAVFGVMLLFSGEHFETISVSQYSLTDVEYSPDGKILAITGGAYSWKGRWISSSDLAIRLYDPTTGEFLRKMDGHTRFVRNCSFSPDGSRLLTVSRELLLWDPQTGELLLTIDPGERTILRGAFLADNRRIVTGARDGKVQIWDVETGELLNEFQAHQRAVTSLDSARSKDFFVTCTVGEILVWDANTCEKLDEFGINYVPVSIRVAENDRFVIVPNGPTIVSYNLESREEKLLFEREKFWVGNIAVSTDGTYLATTSTDGGLQIWERDGMKRRAQLPKNGSDCFGIAFSPDGSQLAAVGMAGELRLWDLKL
ncbi:WD40 repeat domain-containing protein [bacterium]|nr:WD40 repeat domain-containing protein [bacterium]